MERTETQLVMKELNADHIKVNFEFHQIFWILVIFNCFSTEYHLLRLHHLKQNELHYDKATCTSHVGSVLIITWIMVISKHIIKCSYVLSMKIIKKVFFKSFIAKILILKDMFLYKDPITVLQTLFGSWWSVLCYKQCW